MPPKIYTLLLYLLCFCFILSGCADTAEPQMQKYDKQFFDVFDTVSSVSVYADSQEQADKYTDAVHKRLLYLHQQFDPYNTYDDFPANLKALNDKAGKGQPSAVSDELYALLKQGKEIYELTDGKINIAMGATLEVWHKYRDDALENNHSAIPAAEELEATRPFNDIEAVKLYGEIDGQYIAYISKEGVSVNLGAVAKGYAASEALKTLKEIGCDSALINLGGNVACYRGTAKPKSWKVGVQDPQNPEGLLEVVEIDNGHLVSSGDYQRYYVYDGKKIHHIIDPETLMPADKHIGTTVIIDGSTDSALDSGGLDADMLSTALFIMDDDEGTKLAEAFDGVKQVYRIAPNGECEKLY